MVKLAATLAFLCCLLPASAAGYGGELNIAVANDPPHLNPAIASGTEVGLPCAQLFASPLRFDENWRPRPYLAESWEIADDGLSVTLRLVGGATFHDGRPITSKDVAFSVETVKKYHPFRNMFASVEGVDTPDPRTAIIRLSKPHPAILLAMSSVLLPILPEHVYGDGRDIRTHPANRAPVGSGPFKFAGWSAGRHILLERYEGFFLEGRPRLDRIRFSVFHDVREISLSMELGEVHMFSFSSNIGLNDQLRRQKHLVVTDRGYQGVGPLFWLAFNLERKPFDDLRVRKAFAYAIDREFIVETLFKGMTEIATGPIHPDSPFYSTDVESYPLDLEKANRLLDAAGYPRDGGGRRFTVTFDHFPDESGMNISLAEYLHQDLLRKLGVELKVRDWAEFGEWARRVADGDFDLALDIVFNWGDPLIGVHRTYDSRNIRKGVIWSNTQNYRNRKVDLLLDEAASETDFARRKALYAELQKILVEELPVLWLMKLPYFTIVHRDLEGIDDNIWGVLAPLDLVHWRKR